MVNLFRSVNKIDFIVVVVDLCRQLIHILDQAIINYVQGRPSSQESQ